MIIVDKQEVAGLKRAINAVKSDNKKHDRQQKLDALLSIADEVKDLRVDYIIIGEEKAYCCERKEISDMLGALREGRFWNQLRNLHIECEEIRKKYGVEAYPILILEGNEYAQMRKKRGRLTYNQWIGILAGIAEMGIGLIKTGSFDGTISALKLLDKRVGKSSTKYSRVPIKKELFNSIDEEAVHMLGVIKNVGVKKALKLLRKYGSVYDVVMLDVDTLKKELGQKTGEHVYEVIHFNFKENKTLEDYVKRGG